MRKILLVVLILLLCSSCLSAKVNSDPEVHRIIGGLYSLAAAVRLNDKTDPSVDEIASFFKDIPEDWLNSIRVSRVNSAIWVGVDVNQYSTARHYIRDHAEKLSIMDSPEGYAWLGGDYAWIKACDIEGGKLKSIRLKSSRGTGNDSYLVFLSTEGQSSWWQMHPTPRSAFAEEIISKWGVDDESEIHKPAGKKTETIYESVKPSAVIKKPADIHIATRKNSLDMSMNIGDVVFTPVPELKHDRTTVEERKTEYVELSPEPKDDD